MAFHEIRFPTGISSGASGGPERRTEIVALGSGFEERNARWAHSRRRYDAGYGIKSLDDIHAVIAFFEERRGRLHGFRWQGPADLQVRAPKRRHRARSGDRHRRLARRRRSSSRRPMAARTRPSAADQEAGRRQRAGRRRRRRKLGHALHDRSARPAS